MDNLASRGLKPKTIPGNSYKDVGFNHQSKYITFKYTYVLQPFFLIMSISIYGFIHTHTSPIHIIPVSHKNYSWGNELVEN